MYNIVRSTCGILFLLEALHLGLPRFPLSVVNIKPVLQFLRIKTRAFNLLCCYLNYWAVTYSQPGCLSGGLAGTHTHSSTCKSSGLVRTCMSTHLDLRKLSCVRVCTCAGPLLMQVELCVRVGPLLAWPVANGPQPTIGLWPGDPCSMLCFI